MKPTLPYERPKVNWQTTQRVACELLPSILDMSRNVELSSSPKAARSIIHELLDTIIWKYSEAAGKYRGNPLWSHLAIEQYHSNTPEKKFHGLVHEHAFPKSVIIRQVTQPGLSNAEAVALFRKLCVGAVVTREPEDSLLKTVGLNSHCPDELIGSGQFWGRYHCARATSQAPASAFVFADHPDLELFFTKADLLNMRAAGLLAVTSGSSYC